jgi:hypothetical protein
MEEAVFAMLGVFLVIALVVSVVMIVSLWKLFEKAGKPGWACLIPIYSTIVMIEIVRKPMIWLLYLLIPGVNIIFAIWLTNLFVKSYGKDEGFTVGCLLLPYIFYPILAFSKSAVYIHNQPNEMNEIGLQS